MATALPQAALPAKAVAAQVALMAQVATVQPQAVLVLMEWTALTVPVVAVLLPTEMAETVAMELAAAVAQIQELVEAPETMLQPKLEMAVLAQPMVAVAVAAVLVLVAASSAMQTRL